MQEPQLFRAAITAIGITSMIDDEGYVRVCSWVATGKGAVRYHHDRYSICTDDELLTILEATLGARAIGAAVEDVISVAGASGSLPEPRPETT